MYPGCRFMDMHPRERDHMSYAPHHGPGFGNVRPQLKMDPAMSPVRYESFPCYGTYGCPYPLPYYGCYHNQIPDYHSYGLHHPHYAPPQQVYYHGSYPPGSYPFHYLPSPDYSVVDPRYEYDKKGPVDHHCCGCPNHLCQQNENKNVKIEEQTSDEEKDRVDSLFPYELKDQPYPVLWIPPGYKRNQDGEQTIKPESKREGSFDKEAKGSLKPCAQEPGVWNGWLPINLNNLNSLVPGREKIGTEHQPNENSKISSPVGCMPHNPEQEDKLELKDGDQKSVWDPSQYGIFPLKFIENQDKKSMPEGNTKNYEHSSLEDGPKTVDKNVVKKIIPVKQMDQSEEKGISKDDQTEGGRAPKVEKNHSEMSSKCTDKKGEKKHGENNSKPSLSKASKLPPVCLRVDPLPSRRTKSGNSRSLSPPAKKKSEMLSHDKSSSSSTMQESNHQDMHYSVDSDLGRSQGQNKVKSVDVVDGIMGENKIESGMEDLSRFSVNSSAADSQQMVSSGCQDGKGGKSDHKVSVVDKEVKNVNKLFGHATENEKLSDGKCETGVNGGTIDIKESELASTNGASYQKFSEAEAAAIIQSAYRGFGVRRWEPLKKLKEIARIKGELIKVRLDVQSLVSSDSKDINKQKILIGETIMNLLLQLDTMQGLHPSIRNTRKSVAKELVSLQEKLDSIAFQNSDELKESDKSSRAEDISKITREEEREDRIEQDSTSLSHVKSGARELCQEKSHTVMDTNISSVDMVKSELLLGTDGMGRALEAKEPDLKERQLEPLVEVRERSEVHDVREDHDFFMVDSKDLPPFPPSIIEEEKLNPVVQLQDLSSLVDSDWSGKEDEVTKVNTEVPPRMLEQNSDAQVSGEGLQIDGGRCLVPGKLEPVQESGLISLDNEAKETSAEEQQHKKLLTESPKLSDPKDNIATAVCSEGSSDPKDYISAEGDLERGKELSGDDMLGAEFMEATASKEKHVSNIKAEGDVCIVDGDDKSIDDMPTAAVRVDMKELSDITEVVNTCEVEGEGNDKAVEDMQTAGNVSVVPEEMPDTKAAANFCEVEGDDKPVNEMQTSDTVGIEQSETPEIEDFGKDVGAVEDMESTKTWGPELEYLTMATSGLQGKQQEASFVKDTVSGEEVHMEEIGNHNMEEKMAVGEEKEMWEDKFDNKEISKKHSDGDIHDLPRDEDLLEEELGTEKVKKEEELAGEELVTEQPRKEVKMWSATETERESEKKLAEEKEKLKETVEKLIAAGKEQLTAIYSLSERVKDLEKKLTRKKKLKMRRQKCPSSSKVECDV